MTPRLLCLLGAECTGKTSLAQALAAALPAVWVPEYLRHFCVQHGRTPRAEEQSHIAAQQQALETAALAQAQAQGLAWVVCDTAPLLTAVYSEYVFGDDSLYPMARIAQQRYALTLLLQPNFAWQADGLQRDGAHARTAVHAALEREMQLHTGPWQPLTGSPAQRLAQVLAVLNFARP
jgi:nicotinamide riboside kinase